MGIFRNRPLAFVSCAFTLGCAAGALIGGTRRAAALWACLALSLVSAALFILTRKKPAVSRPVLRIFAAFAALLAAFTVSRVFFDVSLASDQEFYGKDRIASLTVEERITSGSVMTVYGVRVNAIDGEDAGLRAVLECGYVSNLQPGYACEMPVTVSDFGSDGLYDRRSMLADGYRLLLTSDGDGQVEITDTDVEPGFFGAVEGFGRRCSETLHKTVGGDEGAVASALVLGDRDFLDGRVSLDFTRAGGTHLLALSGLHVSIILGMLGAILIKMRISRKIRAVILGVLSVFYLALTGFSPSAVRAVIMAFGVFGGWLLGLSADAFTSVSFTAAVMLAFAPSTVLSYSFWLSVAATAGIIVFAPAVRTLPDAISRKFRIFGLTGKILKYAVNSLAVSLIALGSVMTLNALWFGAVSYTSPVTTLALSLPTAGVLTFGIFTLIFCKIPFISSAFAFLCRICARFMLIFTSDASKLDGVLLPLDFPAVYAVAGAASLLICAAAVLNFRRKLLPFAAVVLSVAAVFVTAEIAVYSRDGLEFSYVRTSAASRQAVLSGDYRAVIIDASQGSSGQLYATADKLEHITEIRAFVLTDYSDRHPEMLSKLSGMVRLREIWAPEPENTGELYVLRSILGIAEENGAEVYTYSNGRKLRAFGGELTVSRSDVPYSSRKALLVDFEYENDGFTCLTPVGAYKELAITGRSVVMIGANAPKIKEKYGVSAPEDADLIFENAEAVSFAPDGLLENRSGDALLSPEVYKTVIGGR